MLWLRRRYRTGLTVAIGLGWQRNFQYPCHFSHEVQGLNVEDLKQAGVKTALIIKMHTPLPQHSCHMETLFLKAAYNFLIKLKCQYIPEAFLRSHPDLSSALSNFFVYSWKQSRPGHWFFLYNVGWHQQFVRQNIAINKLELFSDVKVALVRDQSSWCQWTQFILMHAGNRYRRWK